LWHAANNRVEGRAMFLRAAHGSLKTTDEVRMNGIVFRLGSSLMSQELTAVLACEVKVREDQVRSFLTGCRKRFVNCSDCHHFITHWLENASDEAMIHLAVIECKKSGFLAPRRASRLSLWDR
jgi:uncharacterized protein YqeY